LNRALDDLAAAVERLSLEVRATTDAFRAEPEAS
jgi:hypothetical protein